MEFSIVLAVDEKYGIGFEKYDSEQIITSTIPWKIKEDIYHFRKLTDVSCLFLVNAIIMGRKTADTLKHILPNRINIVISHLENYRKIEGFITKSSLQEALNYLLDLKVNNIYVIGGSQLVSEAIINKYCRKIYLTHIRKDYNCNIILPNLFLNELNLSFVEINGLDRQVLCSNTGQYIKIRFSEYVYKNKSELVYLDIMDHIIKNGNKRECKNGFVHSSFGKTLEFDISLGFPLLTTNKIFDHNILKELLFFIRTLNTNQLQHVLNILVNDPYSTKILITTYNSCYGISVQFFVDDNNKISLQTYQESVDWFLDVPFNVALYSAFLHIIVNMVNNNVNKKHEINYTVGKVIFVFGDIYIYSNEKTNYIAVIKKQISSKTYRFPYFHINKKIITIESLNDLTINDIIISN
jgi:dihydrofolate reductase/thymidylate synthase